MLVCAAHHEPWFDEAQAWLIARDSSVHDLFTRWLLPEVSPPLWHLLLIPFAKLGVPYTDLSFISSGFAILGVALFLWRAPFPLWIRLLFPFGYFPLFQYAVVARSYVLFLPILCVAAIAFPGRHSTRRFWYLTSMFLLANVSLHGTLVALCLFVEWVWTAGADRLYRSRPRTAWTIAAAFFLAGSLLFLLPSVQLYLLTVNGSFDRPAAVHRALGQVSEAFFGGMGNSLYRLLRQSAAVIAFVLSLVWFQKTSSLWLYLGLTLPLLALAFVRASLWHTGICLLVWIFVLWISFERFPERVQAAPWIQVVVACVLAVQLIFGLVSWRFDILHTYSGSQAAARYLASTGEDRSNIYALGFKAFAVQPYFHRNLFSRQEHGAPEAFCFWRKDEYRRVDKVLAGKPEKILVAVAEANESEDLAQIRDGGYCEEKRFPGVLWWKNGVAETDTYEIMTPCASPLLVPPPVRQ